MAITEQDIEKTLARLHKLSDEEFVTDYQDFLKTEQGLVSFAIEFLEGQINEESIDASLEHLYNVGKIYQDKYQKAYKSPTVEDVSSIIERMNNIEKKQGEILGYNIEDEEGFDLMTKDIQAFEKMIENNEKLEGKFEKLSNFLSELIHQRKQVALMDYMLYTIDHDELIKDEDKNTIFIFIDMVIQALDKANTPDLKIVK